MKRSTKINGSFVLTATANASARSSPWMLLRDEAHQQESSTSVLHTMVKVDELPHKSFRGIWMLQLLRRTTRVRYNHGRSDEYHQ